MKLEELKKSRDEVGEIYPVLKDQHGNLLDGFHRKRINPNWKETTIKVKDKIHSLRIRLHSNITRRAIEPKEKKDWVKETREVLKKRGLKGTQKEIAKALDVHQTWVSKYDENPTQEHDEKIRQCLNFFGYNVWGFKDDSWRQLIVKGDPDQPDVDFYHGATPAFIIEQLIKMFNPKRVLDNIAGTGTTGYVCNKHKIPCDLFDLNPYPKYNVKQGDAEFTPKEGEYDLIFNHYPYLNMVKYSKTEGDMSRMKEQEFYDKVFKIFKHNKQLLAKDGVYAVLIGDPRVNKQIVPLTAKLTMIGLECGFVLFDEAIKLTAEQKSTGIQEYRAAKHGYLAQTFDTVLIFKHGD